MIIYYILNWTLNMKSYFSIRIEQNSLPIKFKIRSTWDSVAALKLLLLFIRSLKSNKSQYPDEWRPNSRIFFFVIAPLLKWRVSIVISLFQLQIYLDITFIWKRLTIYFLLYVLYKNFCILLKFTSASWFFNWRNFIYSVI